MFGVDYPSLPGAVGGVGISQSGDGCVDKATREVAAGENTMDNMSVGQFLDTIGLQQLKVRELGRLGCVVGRGGF